MLTKDFLSQYEDKLPPWGPMGYIVYKRTYARMIPELGRAEEWNETCERVCRGLVEIGGVFTKDELELLYDSLFNLKGFVSGRALWQLGTQTVLDVGADSLYNCWLVSVRDLESFCFTFNQLMLGGGVGFNVLPQNVYELPAVRYNPEVGRVENHDCDYIVPDNREGWVELLRRVLDSFFVSGKRVLYDTSCIRAKGKPIKGFGGTASGPEDLVKGIKQIVTIIKRRYGGKLTPVDCMDIMNIIGQIVVAGNVRRSSEIALGCPKDLDFLDAKNWGKHQVPNWRTMSNNSAICNSFDEIRDEFWDSGYEPNAEGNAEGEPYGLVNLRNLRRFGRLADGPLENLDPYVEGTNPCGEIGLAHKEGCNLAELVLPNLESIEEAKAVAAVLYKACKTISNHGFSDPGTQEIVNRHHRIGIGITGLMQCPSWYDGRRLDAVYRHLRKVDQEYSKELGISPSIKLTTSKPSGTLSLLPGVTPGIHAAFSRYYMRTVRFSSDHPLVEVCRDHGYKIEPKLELDGTHDHSTSVIYFPIAADPKATLAEELDVINELEVQKFVQSWWADNSVSSTHYFNMGDVPRIRDWLRDNFDESVKACSFLQRVGHGFAQAPYQPISEEEYHRESSKVRPITFALVEEQIEDTDQKLECEGGSCPVK